MQRWQERAIELKGSNSWTETAKTIQREYFPDEKLEIVYNRVRAHLRRNKTAGGFHKSHTNNSRMEYRNDGSVLWEQIIELFDGEQVTPEKLLEAHGLEVGCWEVISCTNNYWESQIKGGRKIVLYQSKLNAKPIKQGLSKDKIREIFKELDRQSPIPKVEYKPTSGRKCMVEVNIADLHYSKLCWHGNTGENYDHKIAKSNFEDIVERICTEIHGKNIDYILFIWSNDYFNSDNEQNTTTKGTPQDTDLRFEKMYKSGVLMLRWAIEKFAQIAPVHTFRTPSNHDNELSYSALVALELYYENDSRVTVDDSATPRYYVLYGNSLTGHGHGDKEGKENTNKDKASRLASLMPNEARELWGKAKFCEMHVAHLHSEQMIQEINGVIVRRIASPTASDTWHVESGYVGSTRKAQTFIYDEEDGIVNIINTPIRQRITN